MFLGFKKRLSHVFQEARQPTREITGAFFEISLKLVMLSIEANPDFADSKANKGAELPIIKT